MFGKCIKPMISVHAPCRSSYCFVMRRAKGITLVELVMVMVILGLLAVVVLPKLSETSTFRASAFRTEVVAALRYAQKTAVSHRRLVCASLTATSVTLTISKTYGSTSCDASLPGPDGNDAYAISSSNLIASGTGMIYFQSSGTLSSDAAGASVSDYTIAVTGMPSISIAGSTGYVN